MELQIVREKIYKFFRIARGKYLPKWRDHISSGCRRLFVSSNACSMFGFGECSAGFFFVSPSYPVESTPVFYWWWPQEVSWWNRVLQICSHVFGAPSWNTSFRMIAEVIECVWHNVWWLGPIESWWCYLHIVRSQLWNAGNGDADLEFANREVGLNGAIQY